jgi:hypothetical protein
MKKSMSIMLITITAVFIYACIPVPVPVETGDSGYYGQPYGYGYEEQYGYDEYGYGYDEYYEVPVVYGEPCYFTPPVSVTFVFDYFTYEVVNGYVDIVFWRGGHRYHRVPWYERGRRMSDRDIRTGYRYRVRGPELYRHRELLRQKHHITHPDAYYGLKKPGQQRPPKDQKPQWENKQPTPPMEETSPWGRNKPLEMEHKQPSSMEHQPRPYDQKPSWEPKPKPQEEPAPPMMQMPRETQPTGEPMPQQQMEQKTKWQQGQPRMMEETPQKEILLPPQREKTPQWGQSQIPPQPSENPPKIKQRNQKEESRRLLEKRRAKERIRKPVREKSLEPQREPKDSDKVRENTEKHEQEMNAAPGEFNRKMPR